MNVSQRGIDLIAEFEGFSATPYNDPAGHCTVGYGELLHLGPCTLEELNRPPITEEQGKVQLAEKVRFYADAVTNLSRRLNANEHAALTSLCYNIGVTGYERSSVRAAVNGGGDVCAELRHYVRGTNGVIYPGLVRRREAECALFNEPVEDEMTPEEQQRLANLELQVYTTRRDLNELANGLDGVSIINKWPLSLKGLWFIVGKAWPF